MLKPDQREAIDQLLKKRDVNKAEKLISRWLKAMPPETHPELLVYRARIRLIGGRVESALSELEKARSLAPEFAQSPSFMEIYADCLFARFELSALGFAQRQDVVQAEALYRQIIQKHPQYENIGWVRYQLGRVAISDSRVDEAIEQLQLALLAPGSVSALTAYCFERLGFIAFYEHRDYPRALMFLAKAIDTYPHGEERGWLVQVHLLRVRVHREMSDMARALQEAEIALKLASAGWNKPQEALAEALFTTAELLLPYEDRQPEVIAHLEQFLQVSKRQSGSDVTRARVYEMLGDAYTKTGDYDSAITAYHAVLTHNPHHPWEMSIYYRIGRAYYFKQNFEKAIAAIQLALESAQANGDTVDYSVYNTLGNAHYAQAEYHKAAEAYATALQLAPRDPDTIEPIRAYYQLSLQRQGQAQ